VARRDELKVQRGCVRGLDRQLVSRSKARPWWRLHFFTMHARMQRAGFFFYHGARRDKLPRRPCRHAEVAHRPGSRPHHPHPGPGKGQPLHPSIRRSIARQLMHMHAHIDRHKLFMLQQKKLPENNNIETASNPSPSPFLSPLPLHTSLLSSWKPTQVNQSLSQHPVACLV
jgi:hypothetical protein